MNQSSTKSKDRRKTSWINELLLNVVDALRVTLENDVVIELEIPDDDRLVVSEQEVLAETLTRILRLSARHVIPRSTINIVLDEIQGRRLTDNHNFLRVKITALPPSGSIDSDNTKKLSLRLSTRPHSQDAVEFTLCKSALKANGGNLWIHGHDDATVIYLTIPLSHRSSPSVSSERTEC